MNPLRHHRRGRGRPRHPDVLTPAEWRVLEHVREGRSNAEIAERLGVSINTVRTQVSAILAKLDVPDRYALAGWRGQPAEPTRRLPLALPLLPWLREHGGWFASTAKVAAVVAVAAVAAVALVAGMAAARDGQFVPASPTPTATATTPAEASPTATRTPWPGAPSVTIMPPPYPTPGGVGLPRDEARVQLAQVAAVRDVLEAMEQQDVQELIDLMERTVTKCEANPVGPLCPDGVAPGSTLEFFFMHAEGFYTMQGYSQRGVLGLPELLDGYIGGRVPQLALATRHAGDEATAIHYLVFEVVPRGDTQYLGFVVDPTVERPIVWMTEIANRSHDDVDPQNLPYFRDPSENPLTFVQAFEGYGGRYITEDQILITPVNVAQWDGSFGTRPKPPPPGAVPH